MPSEWKDVVFDLEGLVPSGTTGDFAAATKRVWCIAAVDLETDEAELYGPYDIRAGLARLSSAAVLYGQNVTRYDLPVLRRLHGVEIAARIWDTQCASEMIYPSRNILHARDKVWAAKHPEFPPKLWGSHSLRAWGFRTGAPKDEYDGGFEEWSESMGAYCLQDTRATAALVRLLRGKGFPDETVFLESRVSEILYEQQCRGVKFNTKRAEAMVVELSAERDRLRAELQAAFPPIYKFVDTVVPKRNLQSRKLSPGEAGYKNVAKGCAYSAVERVEFNPASGYHIADRLGLAYGWKPSKFTKGGKAKTSVEILEDLPYPTIPAITRYQKLEKVLGYLSEGKNAWLRLERGGRIHGVVKATGTVTNRMSHMAPNTGNVPKAWKECRELFISAFGKRLVGCDASGLQLRMLGHYLAPFDGGAFAEAVSTGDPHSYMMEGTRIPIRDEQKRFTYAMLFAAGDEKLGLIKLSAFRLAKAAGDYDGDIPSISAARTVGRKAREGLAKYMKLDQLDKGLDRAAARGYVVSLDDRRVPVLSRRQCLNTLLMSGEAVVMKHALVLAYERLADAFGPPLEDRWGFVLNVHDEWQNECDIEIAEEVGEIMAQSITDAGVALGVRCPLAAEYSIGDDWSQTH